MLYRKTIPTVLSVVASLLLALMVTPGGAFAATINVPAHYATIQAAIDAAVDGGTVLVSDGTYTGSGNKNLDFGGKAITVRSENGPHYCIIDCQNDGRGFYFHSGETSEAVVDGFTITNGFTTGPGAGIACDGNDPTIINCIIAANCAVGFGGGIYCYSADPTIANCAILENTADRGGGVVCLVGSSPLIANCTFSGNSAVTTGGGIYLEGRDASATVANCILWDDNPNEIAVGYLAAVGVCYSDVQGGWDGEGNIDLYPAFVNAPNGDYHLSDTSPCIDAGDDTAVLVDTDLDGNPRIVNGTVDMGAYEFQLVEVIDIDVKPGSYPNAINLGSNGVVPVAILSSAEFNALEADPETVELSGAGVAVRGRGNRFMAHEQDVNGDGLMDLVVQVETENLDPDTFQDGYAILTGRTYGGLAFLGLDEITIVPPE